MTLASSSSTSKLNALYKRAKMLSKVRTFFASRSITEVDTPLLSCYAPIDTHIDLFEVTLSNDEQGYLHSSPEYAMKQLLADGMGDIYQLSHVYRRGEVGKWHNQVFTLIEWYRVEWSYAAFIEELIDLISLFLGDQPLETLSYRIAFKRALSLDPFTASTDELLEQIGNCPLKPNAPRKELLNLLWGSFVEETLGKEGKLTLITDYPADQAALAKTTIKDGIDVAKRFEIYSQGVELANGYHELQEVKEHHRRLKEANAERRAYGKDPLPIDPHFLAALKQGLPDCYGVALGFDRLLMLMLDCPSIEMVLPLSEFIR